MMHFYLSKVEYNVMARHIFAMPTEDTIKDEKEFLRRMCVAVTTDEDLELQQMVEVFPVNISEGESFVLPHRPVNIPQSAKIDLVELKMTIPAELFPFIPGNRDDLRWFAWEYAKRTVQD